MKPLATRAALTLLTLCSTAAWAAPGLCTRGETVFFSCPVQGGKIVSLCGAIQSASDDDGGDEWLQYRFGKPGAIELAYPANKRDSLDRFKGEHVLTHTRDFEIDLQSVGFVSGAIGYQVESNMPQSRKLTEGITIGDPRKLDLPFDGKPRASYPNTFVACASKAGTRHFYQLIHTLRD